MFKSTLSLSVFWSSWEKSLLSLLILTNLFPVAQIVEKLSSKLPFGSAIWLLVYKFNLLKRGIFSYWYSTPIASLNDVVTWRYSILTCNFYTLLRYKLSSRLCLGFKSWNSSDFNFRNLLLNVYRTLWKFYWFF